LRGFCGNGAAGEINLPPSDIKHNPETSASSYTKEKTMAKEWANVRLPARVKAKLEAIQQILRSAHMEGRTQATIDQNGNVPAWFAMEKAIDQWLAHRERSRRPQKRTVKNG